MGLISRVSSRTYRNNSRIMTFPNHTDSENTSINWNSEYYYIGIFSENFGPGLRQRHEDSILRAFSENKQNTSVHSCNFLKVLELNSTESYPLSFSIWVEPTENLCLIFINCENIYLKDTKYEVLSAHALLFSICHLVIQIQLSPRLDS